MPEWIHMQSKCPFHILLIKINRAQNIHFSLPNEIAIKKSEIRNRVSSNICITRNQISYSHSHQRNRQIRVWINPRVLNNQTTRSDRRRVRNPEPLRTNLYKSIQCDGLKPLKKPNKGLNKKVQWQCYRSKAETTNRAKEHNYTDNRAFFCFHSEDGLP